MNDLGNLLELLHTARNRFRNVHAVLEHESDLALWRESSQRWAASQGLKSSLSTVSSESSSQSTGSAVRRSRTEVWHRHDNDWRIETEEEDAAETRILNGARWWTVHSRFGASTNVRPDGSFDANFATDIPKLFRTLFDPAPLVSIADIHVEGQTEIAGRQATAAGAGVRPNVDLMLEDFPFADAFRFAVDAERGVLLRFEALLDTRRFILWQVEQIEFDLSMKDRDGVFRPPPDVIYRPMPGMEPR